jgi:putative membrane protein
MMYMNDQFILGVVTFIVVLILVLIIGGFIFFIKIVTPRGKKAPKTNDVIIEILKTRYAKGEITKEEFEQMKKDIQ